MGAQTHYQSLLKNINWHVSLMFLLNSNDLYLLFCRKRQMSWLALALCWSQYLFLTFRNVYPNIKAEFLLIDLPACPGSPPGASFCWNMPWSLTQEMPEPPCLAHLDAEQQLLISDSSSHLMSQVGPPMANRSRVVPGARDWSTRSLTKTWLTPAPQNPPIPPSYCWTLAGLGRCWTMSYLITLK